VIVSSNWTGKITVFTVFWCIILVICGLGASKLMHTQNPITGCAMFIFGFLVPIVGYRLICMIIAKFIVLPKCRNKSRASKTGFER